MQSDATQVQKNLQVDTRPLYKLESFVQLNDRKSDPQNQNQIRNLPVPWAGRLLFVVDPDAHPYMDKSHLTRVLVPNIEKNLLEDSYYDAEGNTYYDFYGRIFYENTEISDITFMNKTLSALYKAANNRLYVCYLIPMEKTVQDIPMKRKSDPSMKRFWK